MFTPQSIFLNVTVVQHGANFMPFWIYIKFQNVPATASSSVGLGVKISGTCLGVALGKPRFPMRYDVAACVKNSDTRRDDQLRGRDAQSRNGLNLLCGGRSTEMSGIFTQ
jgi:hypothetical protein